LADGRTESVSLSALSVFEGPKKLLAIDRQVSRDRCPAQPQPGVGLYRLEKENRPALSIDELNRRRHIYGRPFTYMPEYKLCFSSNYEPVIKGQDFAIWRRVKRVPWDYTVTPEELIEDFSDRLKQEASGILNWALRGLAAYIKAGKMIYPQKIVDATNQYREEMDIIGRFVKERCTLRPDATAVGSDIYAAYSSWCQENGFYATNSRKFYIEFRKRYVGQPGQKTGRVGETDCNRGTLFHGIGVLVDGLFPVIGDVEEISPV
jgi:hypothetical protein